MIEHRFVCAGHAEVHLQPSQAPLSAEVRVLSRGGCLLVFAAPPAIILDHILEVAFTVEGEPFRLRGQVKSLPFMRSKKEYAVGIAFVAPSQRTQERLADLLESIAEKQWKLGIYP